MVVEVTQDTNKRPMVLIRVLKDHDLVLEFSYVAERKKFLAKLENFLTGQKKNLETVPCFRDHMLMNAETKEKRKLRLEHFFREAYALTFGLKPGNVELVCDVSTYVHSITKKFFREMDALILNVNKQLMIY